MITRRLKDGDIEHVLPMAAAFVATTALGESCGIDRDSLSEFLSSKAEGVAFFVAEENGAVVGMAGVMVFPIYFNPSKKAAQELFWYVDPAHRGAGKMLYNDIKQWAEGVGADYMFMIGIENGDYARIDKLYRRLGYRPSEHIYIRSMYGN